MPAGKLIPTPDVRYIDGDKFRAWHCLNCSKDTWEQENLPLYPDSDSGDRIAPQYSKTAMLYPRNRLEEILKTYLTVAFVYDGTNHQIYYGPSHGKIVQAVANATGEFPQWDSAMGHIGMDGDIHWFSDYSPGMESVPWVREEAEALIHHDLELSNTSKVAATDYRWVYNPENDVCLITPLQDALTEARQGGHFQLAQDAGIRLNTGMKWWGGYINPDGKVQTTYAPPDTGLEDLNYKSWSYYQTPEDIASRVRVEWSRHPRVASNDELFRWAYNPKNGKTAYAEWDGMKSHYNLAAEVGDDNWDWWGGICGRNGVQVIYHPMSSDYAEAERQWPAVRDLVHEDFMNQYYPDHYATTENPGLLPDHPGRLARRPW